MRLIARFGVVVIGLGMILVTLPSSVGAAPTLPPLPVPVSGALGAGGVQAKVTPFGTNGDYHVTITLLGAFLPGLYLALPGFTPGAAYDCSATACAPDAFFGSPGFRLGCTPAPNFKGGPLYIYTMQCFGDWSDPTGLRAKLFNLHFVMYQEPLPEILPGTPPGTSVFNGVFVAESL